MGLIGCGSALTFTSDRRMPGGICLGLVELAALGCVGCGWMVGAGVDLAMDDDDVEGGSDTEPG